jgi:hypothetical protein
VRGASGTARLSPRGQEHAPATDHSIPNSTRRHLPRPTTRRPGWILEMPFQVNRRADRFQGSSSPRSLRSTAAPGKGACADARPRVANWSRGERRSASAAPSTANRGPHRVVGRVAKGSFGGRRQSGCGGGGLRTHQVQASAPTASCARRLGGVARAPRLAASAWAGSPHDEVTPRGRTRPSSTATHVPPGDQKMVDPRHEPQQAAGCSWRRRSPRPHRPVGPRALATPDAKGLRKFRREARPGRASHGGVTGGPVPAPTVPHSRCREHRHAPGEWSGQAREALAGTSGTLCRCESARSGRQLMPGVPIGAGLPWLRPCAILTAPASRPAPTGLLLAGPRGGRARRPRARSAPHRSRGPSRPPAMMAPGAARARDLRRPGRRLVALLRNASNQALRAR